jgi:threonine aldolase
MNFASDNAYGADPQILAALTRVSDGAAASYGEDEITKSVAARMAKIFEKDVAVFPVVTGTAANSLALATLCPPHGAIFCHGESHIAVDECAAPEFFTHGAKLVHLHGGGAKLSPQSVADALPGFMRGVHSAKPSVISITQATELGTVYTPDEIAALANFAHDNGMRLHMDGARFANALVHLGCSAAEMTWKAGVDALSFGATKNGALCAEAVVFFAPEMAGDFEYRRKKSGHLISKMRFIAAQLDAYLSDDLWLTNAARANALAKTLGDGIAKLAGATLAQPVQSNAVFAYLPDAMVARLRKAGAQFYDWEPARNGHTLVRLVVSFVTPERAVSQFLETARQ